MILFHQSHQHGGALFWCGNNANVISIKQHFPNFFGHETHFNLVNTYRTLEIHVLPSLVYQIIAQ
jgi:hypothetical protein